MSQNLHGLSVCSLSLNEPSLMTEIEQHEMNEAAMSLVMFSEQVYDFDFPLGDDDDSMDLDQIKPIEEKILDCVESLLDFREMVSHLGIEKSTTFSDVVAQALPSPLNSKLLKTPESRSSYKCNICDKSFVCYQALCGHKTLHRSIKKEYSTIDDDSLLCDSSEAKKIVSQPSEFEVSQEEKSLCCDESIQEFSEQLSHSGLDSLVPSTLSKSSYDCKICGKSFARFEALGGHQRLHRPIREQLARKRKSTEDCNSLSDSIEARKIVLQPSSFEVLHEKKILHCVESKQDFSELLSNSGFDESSSFSASPTTLRSKLQKNTQSKSSYDCKICGKSFACFEALGGHQRLHRPIREQLARKRKSTEDCNSLSGSSEAKKIDAQSLEVSQEKSLDCVESKQDFSELLHHSGFDKCSGFSESPSSLRSKLQRKTQRKSSSDCKICGKSFVYSKTLDNHQRKCTKDCNSLSDSTEAKKIVSQPLSLEVSQQKISHCVELKQDFSDIYSGFDEFISCSKSSFSASPSPLRSKSLSGESTNSEASKFASLPSSFQVSQQKILHCVESKQGFT